MSIDPEVATTNQPYLYTNDDPLNEEDPLGLCWVVCSIVDHIVHAAKDVGKEVVKVGKAALNNSLVRGFAIGGLISALCVGSAGLGCALAVGGIAGAGLSLANHKVNHTKGDWQGAVVIGGLQGLTNGVTGEIWSELSNGMANSATKFLFRSVPGTIIVKALTRRILGG